MSLSNLAPKGAPPPANVRAVVANNPANANADLTVIVPSFDANRKYEVERRWSPRGAVLPVKGDTGLVTFDEYGDAWLTHWHPA